MPELGDILANTISYCPLPNRGQCEFKKASIKDMPYKP